tara:strand:- start:3974 stop:5215 length:1242 start_codon:yes stop_codon:yes gene_type:complete
MSFFIQSLFIAIPIFILFIGVEMITAKRMGISINHPADMISSLSSGVTNIAKDGLKFGVILVSYPWLLENLMIYTLEPIGAAVLVAFLVQDFTGYWMHRLNHRVNIFWNRHIIHHSSEEFNLSCALRQSISDTFHFSAILMIPAAMLGISHKFFIILGPIHLFMQFWYHTRLIGKMGWLEKIIVTPSHHRVHHAINPEYLDKNYGQILIIWDKLFGSFQPELKSVKPVYGILRPANTWNPIIINYKHLWQLMKDAFYAKYFWDKIRIWFMPTGWRPKDVAERFPIQTTENPFDQIKYKTENSRLLIAWSALQMSVSLAMMFVMFFLSKAVGATITTLLALFLWANVFSYTFLMDGNKIAVGADIVKMVLIGSVIFLMRDEMIPMSITAFFLYGILSTFGTLYFMKKERKLSAI